MEKLSDPTEFRNRGFVFVRNLLDTNLSRDLTSQLRRLSGLSEDELDGPHGSRWSLGRRIPTGWTLPDGVTKHREFWPVIYEPRVVNAVRDLLGPDIRFLQHTDLHVGYSSFNWHRDSVSRTLGEGADWEADEPYAIVRVGIYLRVPDGGGRPGSDFSDSDGKLRSGRGLAERSSSRFRLGLIPATHRPPAPGARRDRRRIERYTGWLSHVYRWIRGENPAPPGVAWVEPSAGDAVIFDPRVIHTGTPVNGPKCSLFLAYGLPNRHSANHVHYYRHLRPELNYGEIPAELAQRLKDEGLYFSPEAPDDVSSATSENRLLSWLTRVTGVRNS